MVSSSRRAVACIIFLVAAAFFAHAQQDQTGSISGKVTFKNKGVASVLVIAIDTNYRDAEERSHNRALTDIDGNYLINNTNAADDAQGMEWIEQSIKVKETFQNLSAKANALYKAGKKEEAIALGEQAVQKGKADKADTSNFEKRLADMKAGKI